MRMMAGIIFVIAQVSHLAAAPNEGPSAEQLFRQFDLFGTWATICAFPEVGDQSLCEDYRAKPWRDHGRAPSRQ